MKKTMKILWKTAAVGMVFVWALHLSACVHIERKSLYAQGLEVVRLMAEMVQSEELVDNFVGIDDLKAVVQTISQGNYTTPKAVYAISITDENLAAAAELDTLDTVSKELKSFLMQRVLSSLITQINAMSGSVNVAAANVCMAGKTFVNPNVSENVIYLYTYDQAVPVAVTFTVGEEHTISASGVFLLYKGGTGGSVDEVKSLFRDIPVEVTEVLKGK